MLDYQTIWFVLWGVLWAVYFMTDGFDLGIGILYPFLGKDDQEKRMMINSIGPVWDGNEVWLVTAGGATFAAFPVAYALIFSYLYMPLLIILFALILRGVAFEFRAKGVAEGWRQGWDLAIFCGSLFPALFFGVAFGNLFQGLPIDNLGYQGSLLGLLNPYGLVTGLLFVAMFVCHGALYLAIRTGDDLGRRAARFAVKAWVLLVLMAVLFFVDTAFVTNLYANYLKNVAWLVMPTLAVASLMGIGVLAMKNQYERAFLASCVTILLVIMTGVMGLYPQLLPSKIDPRYGLTICNASSSTYTLKIMTVVALLFVPLVVAYQLWVYWVFRHPVTKEDVLGNKDAY
jgi:cytochrome bd ubiquinol oxidase subunit II